MKAFFDGLVALFKMKAERKGVDLALSLKAHLPDQVSLDPVRVSRVLAHLIDNAIKFTEEGRVEIGVSWCEYGAGRPAILHVAIEDTGVGIPPDRLGELFNAFTQVDESDTREFGGTGLGLSICHALIHRMGAEIDASSTQGQGSLFIVRLPIEHWDYAAKTAVTGKRAADGDGDSAPLDGVAVLLVEDNRVNQRVAKLFLERYGAEVVVAENGREALQCFESQFYPLVFMDLQMPVMDGFEATDQLKRGVSDGRVPYVVALTASTSADDREMAQRVGVDGFMNKPLDAETMKGQIERFRYTASGA